MKKVNTEEYEGIDMVERVETINDAGVSGDSGRNSSENTGFTLKTNTSIPDNKTLHLHWISVGIPIVVKQI